MRTRATRANFPIFPLRTVLFPGQYLPLHIFEERYKKMLHEVILKDFMFGVVRISDSRELDEVGCIAEVTSCKPLSDGKLDIMTMGHQRFRISELEQEVPYARARVVILEDELPDKRSSDLALAVRTILDDIERLTIKLSGKGFDMGDIWSMTPLELSYYVPASFYGSPRERQRLLEIDSIAERLNEEYELLDATCKHLAARAALKDAVG